MRYLIKKTEAFEAIVIVYLMARRDFGNNLKNINLSTLHCGIKSMIRKNESEKTIERECLFQLLENFHLIDS